jgi:hypothetical protein
MTNSRDSSGALRVSITPDGGVTEILANSGLSPLRIDYRAPNNTMAGIIAFNEGALLTQFGGFNDSIADFYVQLFDENVLPVNGDIPFQQFYVQSGTSFVWNPSRFARATPNSGFSWAISIDKDQLTLPGVYRSNFIYAEGYEGPTP